MKTTNTKTKKIKNYLSSMLLISAVSLTASVDAYAEEGAIRFSNNAFKQVISKSADGSVQYDYIEPGLVLPEDIILYEVVFENISTQDVSDIVVNNPIANNSTYRPGSAGGENTDITFSVDGKTFATPDALIVTDSSGKTWRAKPEDYTVIRWVYKNALKPGEKARVTYKTAIK